MKKDWIVYGVLMALQLGFLSAQVSYSHAKAKLGQKYSSHPIKSVRVYNEVEGQVLFLRPRQQRKSSQELWEIFDEPGGMIHFFPTDSMPFATISLGQDQAEVSLSHDERSNQKYWEVTVPGDTVYLQPMQTELASGRIRYRLFKRFRSQHGIQSLNQSIEIDLLHLFYHPDKRKLIQLEPQDSLRDYPKLFTIMALMIILRQHIMT